MKILDRNFAFTGRTAHDYKYAFDRVIEELETKALNDGREIRWDTLSVTIEKVVEQYDTSTLAETHVDIYWYTQLQARVEADE